MAKWLLEVKPNINIYVNVGEVFRRAQENYINSCNNKDYKEIYEWLNSLKPVESRFGKIISYTVVKRQ